MINTSGMRAVRLDRLLRSLGAVEVPVPKPPSPSFDKPLVTKPMKVPPLHVSGGIRIKTGQLVTPGSTVRLRDGRLGTIKGITGNRLTFQPRLGR